MTKICITTIRRPKLRRPRRRGKKRCDPLENFLGRPHWPRPFGGCGPVNVAEVACGPTGIWTSCAEPFLVAIERESSQNSRREEPPDRGPIFRAIFPISRQSRQQGDIIGRFLFVDQPLCLQLGPHPQYALMCDIDGAVFDKFGTASQVRLIADAEGAHDSASVFHGFHRLSAPTPPSFRGRRMSRVLTLDRRQCAEHALRRGFQSLRQFIVALIEPVREGSSQCKPALGRRQVQVRG